MILVLGGTKSGKTGFAEKKAEQFSQENSCPVIYLASARAYDDEMKIRIKKHQDSRPAHWITIEEPRDIAGVFDREPLKTGAVVLFDCLTMWITNLLMDMGDDFSKEEAETHIFKNIEDFLCRADSYEGEIIIISNLVELGLISPHFLGRTFQDLSGMAHQLIAARADRVYQITAGLALPLK